MGQSATHEAGHEFNKYRLREPLSESFLGTRYRAVSNTPSNLRAASNAFGSGAPSPRSSAFALRLLRAQSTALIDRVARAAKAVRYLDHANVLAPIQLIRAQTRLGVITQDVDGFTLSELLRMAGTRGEALPQGISLRIALDVLEGLEALHATEGDVKHYEYACGGLTPDSIHVGKDGRTRLIDPGVAGAAAGVPFWGHDPVALAYTAPEHSGAEPSFDPCSDGFSVGVMLWEMLAGRSLFGAPTAAETLERLHKSTIPRVQRHNFVRGEPISAAVAHVVSQALQREPTLRFLSCRELADALRASAEVNTHAEIVEHCHRLSGIAAGVFEAAAPPPRSSVSASSSFEIATGRVSAPVALAEATPTPGHESAELPPDLFEPSTARINAPTASFPDPMAAQDLVTPGPITAFPISDFIPSHSQKPSAKRRNYAPLAVAAAVLLGLSFLIWQETLGRSRSGPPLPAAAARPPAAISDKPAAPNTPTVTTESTSSPIAPPVVLPPPAQPTVEVVTEPAPPATPTPGAPPRRRRARQVDPAKQQAQSPATSPIGNGAPFIPDDL
ncbi:MAG TPA: protein kinase [Polyangiales bacterium]|nr:protein kinase [Polyangiales bacterium]